MKKDHFSPLPSRLDDSADVVEDRHDPLPTGQYVQHVRRFLRRTNQNSKWVVFSLSCPSTELNPNLQIGHCCNRAPLDN
jgi:hypothetical protein